MVLVMILYILITVLGGSDQGPLSLSIAFAIFVVFISMLVNGSIKILS